MNLKLTLLPDLFAISKLQSEENIPPWATQGSFFSITRTSDELSIVTLQVLVPANVSSDKGWSAFKVHGPFDFSEVGVVNSLTSPLAQAGISIFAISTFDTDYLMVKEGKVAEAVEVLSKADHTVQ
jgi:hypothetical protein